MSAWGGKWLGSDISCGQTNCRERMSEHPLSPLLTRDSARDVIMHESYRSVPHGERWILGVVSAKIA
eukprot:10395340-Alexandrium_andersonii.AAC.1